MKSSNDIIKKANITPKLRLGIKTAKGVISNGPHRVKFIQDKEVKGVDPRTGKSMDMVAYLVEENGQKKSYRIPKFSKEKLDEIHYLVIRLAEINEGEEVILEMKKRGLKNYIEVTPLSKSSSFEIKDDDIPIINEDESTDHSEAISMESKEQKSEE